MISLESIAPATQRAGNAPAAGEEAAAHSTAYAFEAAFIGEMLRHAGLDKALSSNAGFGGEAFASLLIESYATKLTEQGGFGLAEKIYAQMKEHGE